MSIKAFNVIQQNIHLENLGVRVLIFSGNQETSTRAGRLNLEEFQQERLCICSTWMPKVFTCQSRGHKFYDVDGFDG